MTAERTGLILWSQTRFVVTREFGGTQTMQQAFEQLIEKKTEEHISKKRDKQAV